MDVQAIFGLQFVLSVVAWGVIARFVLNPWLAQQPAREALVWLSLPHAFRHVGMVFLVKVQNSGQASTAVTAVSVSWSVAVSG